ncbi:MAG TPA: alpha/beta fold hydrolase [Woeseiaceae bacterium]|nr:alpha/beta fold hydrolase [Woeseiaceae bacterium]
MARFRLAGLTIALLVSAACSGTPVAGAVDSVVTEEVAFESRGASVPATYVRPAAGVAGPFPIVVMAHGHGGTRDEAGGFRRLAEALARRGIVTIRPDFPGCGQSQEPFTDNNLSNMLADARAALAYARQRPDIDPGRTGIVGYSMGARVAMLLLPDGFEAAVLWSPVGLDGPDAIFPFVGGRSNYAELRDRAHSTGTTTFVTPWGQQQTLGRQWFDDLEGYPPMAALHSYTGALLVISGAADRIIGPGIARAVAAAATSSGTVRVDIVPGAGHGLGFYDDNPAIGERVIRSTADFLVSELFRNR